MILKEFRELRRDRRTLAMIVAMPLLLLVIFGYAANFSVAHVRTAVVGQHAEQVAGVLPDYFDVVLTDPATTEAQARELVQRRSVTVAVLTDTQPATALVDGSNLFAAQATVSVANRMGDAVHAEVLFNPDLKTSWVMIPAIIGLILTFIGTIVTSIGLVRERTAGTLEQLAVMPIRASAVILGKIAPYFLLAALDMTVVTALGVLLFGVPFTGNVAVFALGAAVFLFVVLGLGVFISTISQNAGQAIQVAFMMMLPQILLSGMIFPLDAMAAGVRWIAYGLPLTYFTMISQGVMLRGAPISSLWLPFGALTLMALLIFSGAVLRFRRDLAPSRRGAR
jgi:ABC-2 type transport system permease protein